MPKTDHHEKPFDHATLTKLLLFQEYLTSWLPVFLNLQGIDNINIFDFFCGPGTDLNGLPGSPLRAIHVINQYSPKIKPGTQIALFFCDQDAEKIAALDCKLSNITRPRNLTIDTRQCNFELSFQQLYEKMRAKGAANFIFLDPTGWALTPETFKMITDLERTDFLLFTPSQFAGRFGEEGFRKYLPGFDKTNIKDTLDIHRAICAYYRQKFIPQNKKYYLAPFSIKKNKNVYGLIFGSKSITGLHKFLESCWKINPENGESNFEFRGDIPSTGQGLLIESLGTPKRSRDFEDYVRKIVLSRKVKTNKELLIESLLKGFLGRHAKAVLYELKRENKILRVPSMSFKSIYSDGTLEALEVV
ncbi:three-Cys-motif partner protein TcmP [Desulfocurvus vexinensis]|uniref:three-Cys-motif partner protein TcmP n=1 Tax=Desulfocurvus vexinensis TaxID=399548 RepID=UPI00146FBB17|nr:three-Cys-motif partner protein TcmP [Desulfocurvus vexinensis]